MTSDIPAEAESLAEMALEGSKQLLGPKHPTTVHMLWRMRTLKSHQKEVLLPRPPGELAVISVFLHQTGMPGPMFPPRFY